METGAIPDALFYQNRSSYETEPVAWKGYLDQYIESVKGNYTKRSLELATCYCSRIILFFSDVGINCVQDISFYSIDLLYHEDFGCQKDTWYIYMSHARAMLSYWASQDLCSMELGMLLDERIYPQVGFIESFAASNIYRSGVEIEMISVILGHSFTQTTRIYATPSVETMRKAMSVASMEFTEENAEWETDETELARLCGLR